MEPLEGNHIIRGASQCFSVPSQLKRSPGHQLAMMHDLEFLEHEASWLGEKRVGPSLADVNAKWEHVKKEKRSKEGKKKKDKKDKKVKKHHNAEEEGGGEEASEEWSDETHADHARESKEKKEKESKKSKKSKKKQKKHKKNKKDKKHGKDKRHLGSIRSGSSRSRSPTKRKHEDPPPPLMDCSNAGIFIHAAKAVQDEAMQSNVQIFLDLACGTGGVGKRAQRVHGQKALMVDWEAGDASIIKCDLKDPAIRTYIQNEMIGKTLPGAKRRKMLGASMSHVPCETFSNARHGKPGGRTPVPLRDRKDHVWGLPGLTPKDQMKLEAGNGIARALLAIRDDLMGDQVPSGMENGDMSLLFNAPEVRQDEAQMLKVCYCMMGKKFRKRTRFLAWNVPCQRVWAEEALRCIQEYSCHSPGKLCCRTGEPHLLLRGWARGKALTKKGEKYPQKFVNLIARVLCSPPE